MTNEPISLDASLASFDDLWSPRIVTQVNDYDVRVAKLEGDFVWHVHDNTDEFFLVLDGVLDIGLREDGAERTVTLNRGDVFVVPRGIEHRPSTTGASILLFEPTGTPNTGDRHDEVPDHITTTVGRALVP
ncbi:MAG TPA: cupin domain-containing protein [Jiangellaceae bacterium]